MLKDYDNIKEKTKDLNSSWKILVYLKNIVIVLFKCRKNTKSKDPKVLKIKNGRIILLFNCAVCKSKKNQDLSKSKKLVDYQVA